jgi:aryl-alcohol dehydrogenase-like predicted oxidoreductase
VRLKPARRLTKRPPRKPRLRERTQTAFEQSRRRENDYRSLNGNLLAGFALCFIRNGRGRFCNRPKIRCAQPISIRSNIANEELQIMSPSTQRKLTADAAEFTSIPGTQLKVSRVALGTWAMGGWMWGGTDRRDSIATIHAALHQGINLIDTAPAYGFGASEEIIGEALEGIRGEAVIATKAGLEWRDGKMYRNASRARIMQDVDDSLRRLRTDYIDIYQVHWPDPLVPVEEAAEAMRVLHEQGKIRAIGVSNFSVAQMKRFGQVAPLHVLQAPYNVFERDIEVEILPYCKANKIATFGYGALCRGLLSGRMRPDTAFEGDDLRRIDPKFQPPRFAQYLSAVRQLDQFAQRRFQRRVIQLAVRWVLDQGISVALWGGRRPDQVQAALDVAGWSLDAPNRGRVEGIVNAEVTDPVGPEFMAPGQRVVSATLTNTTLSETTP